MNLFSKHIILICTLISGAQIFCPPTPQGILQSGKPAVVKCTMFGTPVVYTEQIEHDFVEDRALGIIYENLGEGRPQIKHRGCANCKTHSIMSTCGYTLASEADIEEFEAKESATTATEEE